jgi:hypothetical protein
MRPGLYMLTFFLVGLVACTKNKSDNFTEGDYTGTFQRITLSGSGPVSHVTLHLKNNSFSGTSDNARYPGICVGSWSLGERTLHFADGCAWTADFDWTLILDGDFTYEAHGNQLKLWRTFQGHTDVYELTRSQ